MSLIQIDAHSETVQEKYKNENTGNFSMKRRVRPAIDSFRYKISWTKTVLGTFV